ncbi:MAG: hypothetical protein J6R99_00835 [Alphaproteobacteria bacterium]|nr:hypothetical protein [Alphaproteobacteria bacterium]
MAKKFSKEQLVKAKVFSARVDILNALLKEGVQYTVKEVESMVNKFLKKEVR